MYKFKFICIECSYETKSFKDWFDAGQKCLRCGAIYSETVYGDSAGLPSVFTKREVDSMWSYFDFLPLNSRKNITSLREGAVPIQEFSRVEKIVKNYYNIECRIRVFRNDLSPGTRTFKDLAGALLSSVLKENNVKNYVVSSTGNIASSFSRYLSLNGIKLHVFFPKDTSASQEAEVKSYGATVFRVNGDYNLAKKMAEEFAEKHGFLFAKTGVDPTRIEAKKTLAYEMFRQSHGLELPTVYIQALSGGTGPIGVFKGNEELIRSNITTKHQKMILVQSEKCAPMVDAYIDYKSNGFPGDWDFRFPTYRNPDTRITTIATGYPALYPYVAEVVRRTDGDIISVDENLVEAVSRMIFLCEKIRIGPASSIAMLGLFKALKNGLIKDKDVVVVNIGDGVERSPEFLGQLTVDKCETSALDEMISESVACFIGKVS